MMRPRRCVNVFDYKSQQTHVWPWSDSRRRRWIADAAADGGHAKRDDDGALVFFDRHGHRIFEVYDRDPIVIR